jgi:(+)-trans-carveol dehydrogenase
VLPTGWIQTSDTSAATRWLLSDEARFVTGIELLVDAGVVVR